jgi:hypothetical protein
MKPGRLAACSRAAQNGGSIVVAALARPEPAGPRDRSGRPRFIAVGSRVTGAGGGFTPVDCPFSYRPVFDSLWDRQTWLVRFGARE